MKLTIDQCRAISWAVEEAVTRGYTRDADLLRTVLTEARDEFHATSHPDHSGDGGEKAAALDEVIEALKNEREIVTGSMSEYNTSDYSDRLDAKEDAINDCIARVEHMKAALASNKAAAVASPGEEYQVKSDPIMCWETYQDRAVAQKHFDQLKADGCNTQFRVIYTAPIATAEEAITQAAALSFINQFEIVGDNNDSRDPTDVEKFVLREFVLQLFDDTPEQTEPRQHLNNDAVIAEFERYFIDDAGNQEHSLAGDIDGYFSNNTAEHWETWVSAYEWTRTHPAAAQPSRAEVPDAAIKSCALIIKGMCMTHPVYEWAELIEARIRFMLKDKP